MNRTDTSYVHRVLAILADRTDAVKQEVRCEGYLIFGRARDSLRVASSRHTRSSDEHPATFRVTGSGDVTLLIITQTSDPQRTVTIRKSREPNGGSRWDIVIDARHTKEGPFRIIVYPQLEQLLEDLINFP